MKTITTLEQRIAPLEMSGDEFRALGHRLIDRAADFLDSLPQRPVTPGEPPSVVREALGADRPLPEHGADPARLLDETADLLFDHSLFNGHPRFWGYITSSAAPIGALADLTTDIANFNVGTYGGNP
ncbi:MAG: aspartate aminotransferase family protein, partial [Chloroflexota bacterium]